MYSLHPTMFAGLLHSEPRNLRQIFDDDKSRIVVRAVVTCKPLFPGFSLVEEKGKVSVFDVLS